MYPLRVKLSTEECLIHSSTFSALNTSQRAMGEADLPYAIRRAQRPHGRVGLLCSLLVRVLCDGAAGDAHQELQAWELRLRSPKHSTSVQTHLSFQTVVKAIKCCICLGIIVDFGPDASLSSNALQHSANFSQDPSIIRFSLLLLHGSYIKRVNQRHCSVALHALGAPPSGCFHQV
jgi:hypothetical protein